MKTLVALPIFNEERYIEPVLAAVRRFGPEILVVNDGSTDRTSVILAAEPGLHVISHRHNLGYGAALRSAFGFALAHHFDALVTMDCDGQHEPERIPVLLEALSADVDLVSGSRYLRAFRENSEPPADRRRINFIITKELNQRFGFDLTDAFCGFKAYRVGALAQLDLTEAGYAMPLQLWVQAAHFGWRIREVGVPNIYVDPTRAFGGELDNPDERLRRYRQVIADELARWSGVPAGACRR
jgi:dolichol-phosphate mannosyltransferase